MEIVTLGSLTERRIGYGIVQPGSHKNDGIPVIKVNNLITGLKNVNDLEKTSEENASKYNRTKLKGGELIVSVVGTIGKTAIVPEDFAGCNLVRATAMIDIPDPIISLWVKYYIDSPQGQHYIQENLNTTVQPTLNVKSLVEMPIPLYSRDDISQIIQILKSLDDKIENNRRINENLEKQAQALFKSWFVDFEPFKDGEFVESELGMIPKEWRVTSLNEACIKVTDGSHYSPKDKKKGTIPMLSVKDMRHYGFDYSSCKMIDADEFEIMRSNDCVPKLNDILVAKDGSYLKEIFICSDEIKQAVLSSIAIFRSNSNVIYPEILLQLLRLPSVRKDVGDNYVSGSALPRIVLKDFKKFRFIVAPMYIQNRIIGCFKALNIQIHNNELESRCLASLRDTLLPKLMSGQIKL